VENTLAYVNFSNTDQDAEIWEAAVPSTHSLRLAYSSIVLKSDGVYVVGRSFDDNLSFLFLGVDFNSNEQEFNSSNSYFAESSRQVTSTTAASAVFIERENNVDVYAVASDNKVYRATRSSGSFTQSSSSFTGTFNHLFYDIAYLGSDSTKLYVVGDFDSVPRTSVVVLSVDQDGALSSLQSVQAFTSPVSPHSLVVHNSFVYFAFGFSSATSGYGVRRYARFSNGSIDSTSFSTYNATGTPLESGFTSITSVAEKGYIRMQSISPFRSLFLRSRTHIMELGLTDAGDFDATGDEEREFAIASGSNSNPVTFTVSSSWLISSQVQLASTTVYTHLRYSRDSETLAPSLTAPATDSSHAQLLTLTYNLPEAASRVTLSIGSTELTLAAAASTAGDHSFSINVTDPTASANVASGSAVSSGSYTVTLSYKDSHCNQAALSSATNVSFDVLTERPTLNSPVGTLLKRFVSVDVVIPEAFEASSVRLKFGTSFTAILANVIVGSSTTFTFDAKNIDNDRPSQLSDLRNSSNDAVTFISEGTYAVSICYKDALSNPESCSVAASTLTIDTSAEVQSFQLSVSDGYFDTSPLSKRIKFSYDFGEEVAWALLRFVSSQNTYIANITSDLSSDGEFGISDESKALDPRNMTAQPFVGSFSSGQVLPDDDYNVSIAFNDLQGNLAEYSAHASVRIDTETSAPIFPLLGEVLSFRTVSIDFREPCVDGRVVFENASMTFTASLLASFTNGTSGTKIFGFEEEPFACAAETCSSVTPTNAVLDDGPYNVSVFCRDRLGHPEAGDTKATQLNLRTAPINLTSPQDHARVPQRFDVKFRFPDPPRQSSGKLIIINSSLTVTVAFTDGLQDFDFVFDSLNITTNDLVSSISPSVTALDEGSYTFAFTYRDAATGSHPVEWKNISITIDRTTQPCTLTASSPVTFLQPLQVSYTLGETPISNSVVMTFYDNETHTAVLALQMNNELTNQFQWDTTASPVGIPNSGIVSVLESTGFPLADPSNFYIQLRYSDVVNNSAAVSSNASVALDRTTQPITFTSPGTGAVINKAAGGFPMQVQFGELPGVARVRLAPQTGPQIAITLVNQTSFTSTINITDIASTSGVASANATSIADGTYTVTVEYQDVHFNPVRTATAANVRLDTDKGSFTVTAPSNGGASRFPATFSCTASETPSVLQLVFFPDDPAAAFTCNFSSPTSGANTLLLQQTPGSQCKFNANGSTIGAVPDGSAIPYRVRFQDAAGNEFVEENRTVTLDSFTAPVTITSPASNAQSSVPFTLNFALGEIASALNVTFQPLPSGSSHTFQLSVADRSLILSRFAKDDREMPDARYNITVTYQDVLQNAPASNSITNVLIDASTQDPVLLSPDSGSTVRSPINVTYRIPEAPGGSVTLDFRRANDSVLVARAFLSTAPQFIGAEVTALIDPHTLVPNSPVVSMNATLPDQAYRVVLSYADLVNPAASVEKVAVTLDTITLSAQVLQPEAGAFISRSLRLAASLPEAALGNAVSFRLRNSSSVFLSCEAVLSANSFAVTWETGTDPANSTNRTNVNSITCSNFTFSEGTYDVEVSYADAVGNAPALTTAAGVSFDFTALTPILHSPSSNQTIVGLLNITYELLEVGKDGGVELVFTRAAGTRTLVMRDETLGVTSFTFNTSLEPSAATPFVASSDGILLDDVYTVRLRFKDRAGNDAFAPLATDVRIDTRTDTPVVTSPRSDGPPISTTGRFFVAVTFPEPVLAGSVFIALQNVDGAEVVRLQLDLTDAGNVSIAWNAGQSLNLTAIVQGATIASVTPADAVVSTGTYTVTVGYRDANGNALATTTRRIIVESAESVYQLTLSIGGSPTFPANFSVALANDLANLTGTSPERWFVRQPASGATSVTILLLPPRNASDENSVVLITQLRSIVERGELPSRAASLRNFEVRSELSQALACFDESNSQVTCPEDDDSSSNTVMIAVIAGVSGVVFIVVVLIAVRYTKRAKKKLTSQDIENEFDRADKNKDGVLTKEEYANLKRQDPDVEFVEARQPGGKPVPSGTDTNLTASGSDIGLVNKET
jgi:hypothetical protein